MTSLTSKALVELMNHHAQLSANFEREIGAAQERVSEAMRQVDMLKHAKAGADTLWTFYNEMFAKAQKGGQE